MAVGSDTPLLVATGGKENDLKIWDGISLTFQAKNVSVALILILVYVLLFYSVLHGVRLEMISLIFECLSGRLLWTSSQEAEPSQLLPWEQGTIRSGLSRSSF